MPPAWRAGWQQEQGTGDEDDDCDYDVARSTRNDRLAEGDVSGRRQNVRVDGRAATARRHAFASFLEEK
jgi:hypothetical protein